MEPLNPTCHEAAPTLASAEAAESVAADAAQPTASSSYQQPARSEHRRHHADQQQQQQQQQHTQQRKSKARRVGSPADVAAAAAEVSESEIDQILLKTSRRKGKKEIPADPAVRESIRRRIAESRVKRATRSSYHCPACTAILSRSGTLATHVARCCPDILSSKAVQRAADTGDDAELSRLLEAAGLAESKLRRRALEITFLPGDASGGGGGAAAAPKALEEGDGAGGAPMATADEDEEELAFDGSQAALAVASEAAAYSAFLEAANAAADEVLGAAETAGCRLCSSSSSGGGAGENGTASHGAAAPRLPVPKGDTAALGSKRQRVAEAPADIAAQLGLPLERAQRLLLRAMRGIPLAHDKDEPVQVVYEDEHFLAVCKPPNVHSAPTHRWRGGSMVNRLLAHLGGRPSYLVHRLDVDTSGLLLFGKTPGVVPGVMKQFRDRTVAKEYLAVVIGVPAPPDGGAEFLVDACIGRHPAVNTARRVVPPSDAEGKPATTAFRVEAAAPGAVLVAPGAGCKAGQLWHERGVPLGGGCGGGGGCDGGGSGGGDADPRSIDSLRGAALVRCFPKTGRTHQIRLHLAQAGHPIIADAVYGVTGPWMPRQALHAHALTITHPLTGQRLRMVAPLPADFRAAAASLGLTPPQDAL